MNAIEIKNLLKFAFITDDSILINGDHGIGKTSVVKQYAKENNMYFQDLILSLKEPSDLLGMPDTLEDKFGKSTVWNEPDWFKKITNEAWPHYFDFEDLEFIDEGFKKFCNEKINDEIPNEKLNRAFLNSLYKEYYKLYDDELFLVKNQDNVHCKKSRYSVLFLDELNRALLDTRQTSLQLVLEKELHTHRLPFIKGKQTQIIAAINPPDKYQTAELDLALLDRFTVIDMEIDINAFLKFCKENGIDVKVMDFISEFKDRLHVINENGERGPTPRSWVKVSDYLKSGIDKKSLLGILKGRLGESIGFQFYSYVENYNKSLNLDIIEKIINEKSKTNSDINTLIDEIKEMTKDVETIRKNEILNQSIFNNKSNLIQKNFNYKCLTLLVLIYAFETEITFSVLQTLKRDAATSNIYFSIVNLDETLNDKKFFNAIALSLIKI